MDVETIPIPMWNFFLFVIVLTFSNFVFVLKRINDKIYPWKNIKSTAIIRIFDSMTIFIAALITSSQVSELESDKTIFVILTQDNLDNKFFE